ncbi:MAG: GDSL-type esterase/lipase family protein [Bacteroidota bacterium]
MENNIIFLGDSLTEWGNWKELFPGKKIMNFGIAGDTTGGLLRRLNSVCRHKASKIFLMIGINDLGDNKDVREILSNYERVIQKMKKECPGTEVHLISVLPALYNKFPGSAINHDKVLALNKGIQKIASQYQLNYINLASSFSDKNGSLDRRYTIDGLHLSKEGYEKWKKGINKYIN